MKENQKQTGNKKSHEGTVKEKLKTHSLNAKKEKQNSEEKKHTPSSQQKQQFNNNSPNNKSPKPVAKKEDKYNRGKEEMEESTSWENSSAIPKNDSWNWNENE